MPKLWRFSKLQKTEKNTYKYINLINFPFQYWVSRATPKENEEGNNNNNNNNNNNSTINNKGKRKKSDKREEKDEKKFDKVIKEEKQTEQRRESAIDDQLGLHVVENSSQVDLILVFFWKCAKLGIWEKSNRLNSASAQRTQEMSDFAKETSYNNYDMPLAILKLSTTTTCHWQSISKQWQKK